MLVMLKQFDRMYLLTNTTEQNKMTKSQGVFKELNGTFTVLTFTKSWNYKTEKAATKKWAALVAADLV
jgi:hypothetical protein